ncbi:MAG: hypothetical protein AAF289_12385 [Cyanobacteria bacterium P01_A01_bin.135]
MANQNRSATDVGSVDSPINVLIAALLIFGSIAALVIWALQSAYSFA